MCDAAGAAMGSKLIRRMRIGVGSLMRSLEWGGYRGFTDDHAWLLNR
jgi:hypothetical protein